ncbi:MAG TPA: hypothetical protein VLE22_23455 [Bryobacteraceae bacterium]|nr:hypothetical protein [Bryobacteraceae bacterium]
MRSAAEGLLAVCFVWVALPACAENRHAVPGEHPRLFGSKNELRDLAKRKPGAYQRVLGVALEREGGNHEQMISSALVYAISGDEGIGRQALELTQKYVDGPIRTGHETFGRDLARCAIVYDLCWPLWTPEQRNRFHSYMNRTVDANLKSETSVFHNGWYSYKQWGIGLAAYATYYENKRAPEILAALEKEFRSRVIPAFKLAGDGGGWAEGYYVNYWSHDWLVFCDVALRCEGVDYFAMSPEFMGKRALASMFESYPGIGERNSRRPVPIGDSGGRVFTGERDKALSARRILVNRFRDDPVHQVVHAFNETTPVSGSDVNAYKDFLWRDTSVRKGDLKSFKLSHLSAGPGFVFARSSWEDDATYFFFQCGDRFTSHQQLDAGNFLIYKYDELIGNGGHFYSFASDHEVNYLVRTIAHNTILTMDPREVWPAIRGGKVTSNDGGQMHDWPHHNGSVEDAAAWEKARKLYDIADILAFEDRGGYLYVAGDCSRAYSPKKLKSFTRQIVYIRPGTFVIFDRVNTTEPAFRKTFLLQAMKKPEGTGRSFTITNGKGRLFVQSLLPDGAEVKQVSGAELYRIGGRDYPPDHATGPASECRVEISPSSPRTVDYFLHVLTATDASVSSVPRAAVTVGSDKVTVTLPGINLTFAKDRVGGEITIAGKQTPLPATVVAK